MASNGDRLYVIDFDRTLADTDKLFDVFLQVAEEYVSIPREQIEAAAADVSRRGDSFDTAGYVRDYLSAHDRLDDWEKLTHWYIRESGSLDMLLPGAQELLQQLDARQRCYGILTYGNPLWQRLKLSAARLNHLPHIITTSKYKGDLIASWKDGDIFLIPAEFGGGRARQIILVDDKAVSFRDFPTAPSKGYWIVAHERELPSQQGSVPSNVTRVESLYDIQSIL